MQKLFAVFALCLLAAVGLFGQNATGRVIGVVTDPSGSVIPKAKITVTNVDTGVSTETATGDDGSYQALLLPIGMYRVAAEAPGFHKTVTAPQKLFAVFALCLLAAVGLFGQNATGRVIGVVTNGSGGSECIRRGNGQRHAWDQRHRHADRQCATEWPQRHGSGSPCARRCPGIGWTDHHCRRDRVQRCRVSNRFGDISDRWWRQ
ncbi:MAG: hypothetical protein DMG59_00755 [Acidobacteria bacterium]|nr:MAG: hypothetical protein DMG59_00755 [Acidobacteriota bacterium]